MSELLKTVHEMTDDERDAEVARFCDEAATWFQEFDVLKVQYDAVRLALVDPAQLVIDRKRIIGVCNYVEKVAIMMHAVVAIGSRNVGRLQSQLRMADCAFCDWKYTKDDVDVLIGAGLDREFTETEIQAVHDDVGAAIREHVKVCPNHPMRAVERELARRQ